MKNKCQGLDDGNKLDESFYMESLGLMAPAEDGGRRIKMEPDDSVISDSHGEGALLGYCGPAELKPDQSRCWTDFNCSSTAMMDHDEKSFEQKASASTDATVDVQFSKRSLDLKLNYEAVTESWESSPWADGQRPDVQLDDLWPHAHHYGGLCGWPEEGGWLGTWGGTNDGAAGDGRRAGGAVPGEAMDELFAKKIQY